MFGLRLPKILPEMLFSLLDQLVRSQHWIPQVRGHPFYLALPPIFEKFGPRFCFLLQYCGV